MNNYFAVVRANSYNDVTDKVETEYFVLTDIADFKDAATKVEEYYGDTLEEIEIKLFEGPFIFINSETFESFFKDEKEILDVYDL